MTRITETALRDAHQSLIATRLRTADIVAAAPLLDAVGHASLEAWGGATFDSCVRFLNEDPWDRLVAVKQAAPRTPIQMLLRGQNLVGYRTYADDVVEEFVRLAAKNGVDVFRVFNALNDIEQMETALRAVKASGKHAEGAIAYTTSPFHTTQTFVALGRELRDRGCDSICIKDMSGIITPRAARELVAELKRAVGLPVGLHSHCTAGLAPMAYQAAIDAGVDRLDCAVEPFSGGTSQPATESTVLALADMGAGTDVDLKAMSKANAFFREVRDRYEPLINPISLRTDTRVLTYQIPGGMLSNLLSQLEAQKALHRFEEVLDEVPKVRADTGYPPLVTPTSQIVGVQAVFNVLLGRYKMVSNEIKDLVRGVYGRTPAPIDPEFKKKILGKDTAEPVKPEPELPALRETHAAGGLVKRPEDLITLALNQDVGRAFLAGEAKAEKAPWEK